MAYTALARKYRPNGFADVVGQDHIVRTLNNAIELDRVHHAFLFTGARGVGKTSTARILARCLNCANGPTAAPCGTCPSCVEIAAGNSPDVLEIDGASNTGVDNVRELRETVRYLPSTGRFKIYIIDEVHMLSTAAFNALLKTLEEPPAHVKFMFATTEPQKIPITILSRCQRFDFRRVSTGALAEHVGRILAQENVALGPAAINALVREAQGSVRDALSLLDQALAYVGGDADDATVIEAIGAVDRQLLFALTDALIARDAAKMLTVVGTVDARGHDLADVASLLVEHFRDVMVAKVVEDPAESLAERSPDELEQLAAQAGAFRSPDLHRYFTLMVRVAEDVARSNFPRVSLEMGLLRLLEVEPAHSLSEVLAKLDGAVRSGGAVGAKAPAKTGGENEPVGDTASRQPRAADRKPMAAFEAPASSVPDTASPVVTSPSLNDWTALVDLLHGSKPGLAAVLEHARPLKFAPEGVCLGYESGFYLDKAREKDNRQQLGEALKEHFGAEVGLELVEASDTGVVSVAELREHEAESRESSIRTDALEHPAVKGAVSILGGEVKEVTSLGAEE